MQANFNLVSEMLGKPRLADYLIDSLHRAGVTHLFALPAESLNPILDAARKDGRMQVISVRHEGNSALMASAFGKLTGRPGVCMGTAGPGVTHLPIGTYDAKADGAPLIAISGQVPIQQVGSGGFQEINQISLLDDSTVFNRMVTSVRQTAAVSLACAHAVYYRSAVHLAFPSDVLGSPLETDATPMLNRDWLSPRAVQNEATLKRAAARLGDDEGEVVVVVGALEAQEREAVEKVAAQLRSPIVVLPEGIHYLRERSQHATVRLDDSPQSPVLELLRGAKRVLVVGPMSASIRARLAPTQWVLHVAPSSEVARPLSPGCTRLVGEVSSVLNELARHLKRPSGVGKLLTRAESLSTGPASAAGRELWAALDRSIPEDAVIALEPGSVLEGAFHHLPLRQRKVTSSFHHGSRGYAFPAAVAASLAFPNRPAFALTTEEGMSEAMADVLTTRKYDLPVKVICLEQEGTRREINFQAFAQGSGMRAVRAESMETVPQVVTGLMERPAPAMACVPFLGQKASSAYELRPAAPAGKGKGTLAGLLVEALVANGITRIYGRQRPELDFLISLLQGREDISFVPVLHGESASMMASAYSKWTGKPGVCIAADGPDLLLQLNGLYDAAFDRAPLLMLTAGAGAGNQLVNPERLLADVSCTRATLKSNDEAPGVLFQILEEAKRSRGVAHLMMDWAALSSPAPVLPDWFEPSAETEPIVPQEEMLNQAVARLLSAHRPAILVGRGATNSEKEVEELASFLRAPVIMTMPARGTLSDDHPHAVGGIGASGHRSAIDTLEKCDVLLVLGSSNRGAIFGFVGDFTIIQIDNDPLQLGRRPFSTMGLYGSTRETLQVLNNRLQAQADRLENRAERDEFLTRQRARFERWCKDADRSRLSVHRPIRPPAICHTLNKVLADLNKQAVLTVDVGVTTLWVYRHFVGGNHDLIWTSSFATMGFSLPAAIAIGGLERSRPVIAMAGDGGIGITMAELASATQLGVPVVAVIFNNGKLAAVKYEQEVMGWPEFESRLFNCDFSEYARACGAHGIRVTEPEELESALREAVTCGKPCLVEVVCDPHDIPAPPKVHPLQAAGILVALSREMAMHVQALRGQPAPTYQRKGYDNDVASVVNNVIISLEDASASIQKTVGSFFRFPKSK